MTVIGSEDFVKFLCWVNSHSEDTLTKRWMEEERTWPQKHVFLHGSEDCIDTDPHTVLKVTETALVQAKGREDSVMLCETCIEQAFESKEAYKQALDVYRRYKRLKEAERRFLAVETTEQKFLGSMRIVARIRKNQENGYFERTDLVEELLRSVCLEETELLSEHDTETTRAQRHAWIKRLTLLNKAAFTVYSSPNRYEYFAEFFAQVGTEALSLQKTPSLDRKVLQQLDGVSVEEQEALQQCVEVYKKYAKHAEKGISVIAANHPSKLPNSVRETLVWQYLQANLLYSYNDQRWALYRIDLEAAQWMEYVAKLAAPDLSGQYSAIQVELLSKTDVSNEVLDTALKIWATRNLEADMTLGDAVSVAQALLA